VKTKIFSSLNKHQWNRPIIALALMGAVTSGMADPQLSSWFATDSGQYARLYETTAAQTAGTFVTTWSNSSFTQSLPAYSGVQEIDYSSDWVYIRSTGLGFHIMGPWYLDADKTTLFPNLPVNTKTFTRIPRTSTVTNAVPTSKTATGLGAIGCFVDGVAMYNSWDAYYWNGTTDTSGGDSTGYYWRRDAYVNEGVSFDPSNAHQDQSGTYHYHANPPGLRYLLGDEVSYGATTDTYTETPTNLHHSPILAWTDDGYPLYGPYGYSNATNASSAVRRMVSGYALRNGQNGTDNLTATGRTTIPAWAVRLFGVSSNQSGPSVSTSYPLGRYMEDNDYLGDLGETQGVDFDLDEYNGRYCVTPDFPNGTYAYFVSIASDGTPVYPYNIGAGYYGDPTGGTVSSLTETVVTNYLGGPNATLQMSAPSVAANNTVTLVWSSVQGGTYEIEASTNLTTWTNKAANITAQGSTAQTSFSGNCPGEFYQAVMTNLASYDPVSSSSSSGSGGITSVFPASYGLGASFVLTIYLNSDASPALPPASAPVNSVTIGSNSGTSLTHVSQTEVQATFDLAGATGVQTVSVVFPGPPGMAADVVTYTLTSGFTIQ
jgi:hypothetical protein